MHYFQNMSSASGGYAPDTPGDLPLDPAGGLQSFTAQTLYFADPWTKILPEPMLSKYNKYSIGVV